MMKDTTTKKQSEWARLTRAFGYSIEGWKYAYKHEPAFRLEVLLAFFLVPLAIVLPVSGVEKALLFTAMALVLMSEIVNSAIEAVVDRISDEIHPLSKAAKDLGSTAVLIALVLFWVIWGFIAIPAIVRWVGW